ncbi:hypothetical protein ACF9IK_08540 [Kitasatospora hibisci]|uniref:hypothetical protein n=1 Tax=Kitasatospora hibisci TaxID=3369522 RepID=UPI003754D1F9
MSIVIKFFAAADAEAAAAVAQGGPDAVFGSLTFGNFDVEEALIEWEGIFTGRSLGCRKECCHQPQTALILRGCHSCR